MKKRIASVLFILMVLAFLPGSAPPVCTPPQVSCGCACCDPNGKQITARSAFAKAEPIAKAVATDVELRQIMGINVSLTGALSSNGSWGFVFYSPSKTTMVQVNVSSSEATSTRQESQPAPGPGTARPVPSSWADSSTVWTATNGHRDPSATLSTLSTFNTLSSPQARGQPVWGINFNRGNNQLVRADGTYIGAQ